MVNYSGLFTYTHKPTCWLFTNNNVVGRIKTHDTNDRFSRVRLVVEKAFNIEHEEAGQYPQMHGAGAPYLAEWSNISFGD